MADDNAADVRKLRRAIAALEAQQRQFGLDHSAQLAELRRRLEEARRASQKDSRAASTTGQGARGRRPQVHVSQRGSGATATGSGVAAGKSGVAVGGDVVGDIYHLYQSPPGQAALTQQRFERILDEYLRWVQNAYNKARLYGLESVPTAQSRPVRELSTVFVPLTLRRFQPLRREQVEEMAALRQAERARAYLRLAEEQLREGAIVPLRTLLTLHDRLAIIGGAGSGKSTILAYLAASLATAAQTGEPLPVELPPQKTALVPLVIPLRYFREYMLLCDHSPQEVVRHPRAGTLAGFIPWYLKRRSPALETSEDFFDRLLLGGGCLLMLDGLDAELFQFVHLTFQEFLAARWLAKQRQAAYPHLQPHLTDPWWREVMLLTYGFAQVDHPPFARDYLEWLSTQPGAGEARLAGLELAGAALLELEKPNPDLRQRQAERLLKALRDPSLSASAIERAAAGDTLARLGDPRFRAEAWYLPDEPLLGFVEIPAGPFLMGSDTQRDPEALDNELPQHQITLPRYFIGRYPVTVAQFRAFVEASGYQMRGEGMWQGLPTHPMGTVLWSDALQYCQWLTARLHEWAGTPEPLATLLRKEGYYVTLPSEAEWEKAARGSDGRIYPWGNEADPARANYADTGIRATSAVGCFPGGASPYGVEDLSGNAWEWTRSLWDAYPYPAGRAAIAPRENLEATWNTARVVQGGAFRNDTRRVRCACRVSIAPVDSGWDVGFRIVVRPCS